MSTNLSKAVRAILSELATLGATAIESQLRDLLEQDQRGEDISLQLLQLLEDSYPQVWQRIQEVLEQQDLASTGDGDKGYSAIPGLLPVPREIDTYSCSNPACQSPWLRVKADIPPCPKCGHQLIKRPGK